MTSLITVAEHKMMNLEIYNETNSNRKTEIGETIAVTCLKKSQFQEPAEINSSSPNGPSAQLSISPIGRP